MITDTDRSYYIGASDTKYVVGNWDTETFGKWWQVKKGVLTSDANNIYLTAGNLYEGRILDHLGIDRRNDQIIIGRLRVNFDGMTDESVIEVKTYKWKPNWKPPKEYINQTQVEMYAALMDMAYIAAYAMTDDDYKAVLCGQTLDIDDERLSLHPVFFDKDWINEKYLPKLNYLSKCLREGKFPIKEEFVCMRGL